MFAKLCVKTTGECRVVVVVCVCGGGVGGIIVVQVFVCVHIAHLCVYVLVYERERFICVRIHM